MVTDILEKTYIKSFPVGYPQMEPTLAVKPSALFNFLQDMASEHAEKIGFGYAELCAKNQAWFLLKYRMEFDEYPAGIYSLSITTEPRGYRKMFAHRNFAVYANDTADTPPVENKPFNRSDIPPTNRLLGRVSSVWAVIDVKSGGLVSPQTLNSPYMQAFEKCGDDLNYGKIPPITNADVTKDFEIRYEDIDVNGHVNNINYFIWAFETLDFDFRSSHRLKTLDVVFKKEVKYGDLITSQMVFTDANMSVHVIKNSAGEDLCLLQAGWSCAT
jgi:medium-chain acyl-[acyl-carrier-protein] hydrolase